MRRKIASLKNKLIKFHDSKEKAILEYISKLDHILYLISEFVTSKEELLSFIAEGKIKDNLFYQKIEKEFGIQYDVAKSFEISPPIFSIYREIEYNLTSLANYEIIIEKKITQNNMRLEPQPQLLKNRSQIHPSNFKNANFSASIIKNKYTKYHQEKEIFLYSLKSRVSYIRDIVLDINKTILEIKSFIKEHKELDNKWTLELKNEYGFYYRYIGRLKFLETNLGQWTLSKIKDKALKEKEDLLFFLNYSKDKKSLL